MLMALVIILSCTYPLSAQSDNEQLPSWVKQWKDWAASTNNPEFKEWANKLCSPEAVKAGKEWEQFLGYNAVDLVARDTTAPSIQPGLVITPENVKQYEKELRELFPYGFDWEVDRLTGTGVFAGRNHHPLEMVIVPTTHAGNDLAYIPVTKQYAKNCRIDDRGELTGWVAGIAFPQPKTAIEIVYNYDRLTVMADNLNSLPVSFGLYNKKGERERVEKVDLHWQNYVGRIKVPPLPVIPGFKDVYEKGSILALYPYDLKGFAAVRTRYRDPNTEDSFISYIPALRRIRRLSGSNTQDPLVGSDLSWEDWKGFWSKLSVHPAEYTLLGEAIVLCPSFNPKPIRYSAKYGGWCQRYWWERRPVWVVKITYKEKNYLYGARIWYVDKETFAMQQEMLFDQQGRLWKLWDLCWRWDPESGELDYWNPWVCDIINNHTSILDHHIMLNMPNLSEDLFNLKYLSTKGH